MSVSAPHNEKFLRFLSVGEKVFSYYSLDAFEEALPGIAALPRCLKVFAEKLLMGTKNKTTFLEDAQILCTFYASNQKAARRIFFQPTRIVLSARDAVTVLGRLITLADRKGGAIGPRDFPIPLDIIVNEATDFPSDDKDSLALLRHATRRIPGCRLICAPENPGLVAGLYGLYDFLARTDQDSDAPLVTTETAFGSSNTVGMLGASGCLGFSSDTLDLEEIVLEGGARIAPPKVVGVKVTGKGKKDVYATDVGLALAAALEKKNTNDGIIEFFGPGLDQISFADRAVIADIVRARTDARSVFFPPDVIALAHLVATGLSSEDAALYETHAKTQKLWRESWPHDQAQPTFSDVLEFSLAGTQSFVGARGTATGFAPLADAGRFADATTDGAVFFAEIAARSGGNAREMIATALLAKKACEKGLAVKPCARAYVACGETSCAFLDALALRAPLEAIGFLFEKSPPINKTGGVPSVYVTSSDDLKTDADVLTLRAAPSTVVAFALAGTTTHHDFSAKPLGVSKTGEAVFLRDILPTDAEIKELIKQDSLDSLLAQRRHAFSVMPEREKKQEEPAWREGSPYARPSAIVALSCSSVDGGMKDVRNARLLALLGENAPASTFAPNGKIAQESASGAYLIQKSVSPEKLGSFEDYPGNMDVLFSGLDPSWRSLGQQEGPLVIVAGKNFGIGAPHEAAAILLRLLGVRFALAESFAPIWRAHLVKAGILPLLFKSGVSAQTLDLHPGDKIAIVGIGKLLRDATSSEVLVTFEQTESVNRYMLVCALEDRRELDVLKYGGLWGAAHARDR